MHHLYRYLRSLGAPMRDARHDWLPRLEERHLAAGRHLQRPGDDVAAYYVLGSGTLRIYGYRGGKDVTTWISTEPQLFADLGALRQNAPTRFGFELLTDATVYVLDRVHVLALERTSLSWNQLTGRVWE